MILLYHGINKRYGNTINWLLVKSFQYKKDHPGVLFYRYNYGDEYKAIRISGRGRYSSAAVAQQAYDYRIPISQAIHQKPSLYFKPKAFSIFQENQKPSLYFKKHLQQYLKTFSL